MIHKKFTLDQLNNPSSPCMPQHLGIEITEIGDEYICGRMPVDHRTQQPMGLLHGGASVVLAETLGSIGGWLSVEDPLGYCVGLEINANHIRSAREGYVYGKASPLHLGRNTQVWEIKITDEKQRLVCISRLTLAVMQG
jgi:1,4-dihydroxy-2-naphthoyl-CoA hydrolase